MDFSVLKEMELPADEPMYASEEKNPAREIPEYFGNPRNRISSGTCDALRPQYRNRVLPDPPAVALFGQTAVGSFFIFASRVKTEHG